MTVGRDHNEALAAEIRRLLTDGVTGIGDGAGFLSTALLLAGSATVPSRTCWQQTWSVGWQQRTPEQAWTELNTVLAVSLPELAAGAALASSPVEVLVHPRGWQATSGVWVLACPWEHVGGEVVRVRLPSGLADALEAVVGDEAGQVVAPVPTGVAGAVLRFACELWAGAGPDDRLAHLPFAVETAQLLVRP